MTTSAPAGVAARCAGLVRIYEAASGEVHALKGIDATFFAGRVTAVTGPSGSGKSSLLRILAGMDRPTGGAVSVAGIDLASLSEAGLHRLRRRHVGYLFQRPGDNLVPYLSVEAHLRQAAKLRGVSTGEIQPLLERLGIDHRRAHRPAELSGGEQQRAAVAQAVIGGPTLVLADEPTAELDSVSGAALLEVIHDLAATGTAFVVSTHDSEVAATADGTLALRHGAVEAEISGGRSLSVIDDAGRVQLPPEALARFPARRAVLRIDDDGVRLDPP